MLRDYFFLAFKNLKRRKLRSWLTILGIFIGVAAVISLISLGEGLRNTLLVQISSLGTDKLVVKNEEGGFGPPGSIAIKKLTKHDLKLIEGVKGVEVAIPRYLRQAKIYYNKRVNFYYVTNIPEDKKQMEILYTTLSLKTEKGRLLKEGDKRKVLVGSDVAKKENFDKEIEVGKKIKIQDRKFEVVGILKKSSNIFLNDAIFLLTKDLKDTLDVNDEIDFIIVKIKKGETPEEVAKRIEITLRKDRGLKEGEEDFSIEVPLEAFSVVNDIITAVNIIVIGIAAISLIVGGIGIANTMYTSVLERSKEIGIMKAIGARNSDILIIFLIEAGIVGLVGGIFGICGGLAFSYGVSYGVEKILGISLITINLSPVLLIFALVFSFLIGTIFGFIPSFRASKLKPAESLRK